MFNYSRTFKHHKQRFGNAAGANLVWKPLGCVVVGGKNNESVTIYFSIGADTKLLHLCTFRFEATTHRYGSYLTLCVHKTTLLYK